MRVAEEKAQQQAELAANTQALQKTWKNCWQPSAVRLRLGGTWPHEDNITRS